MSATSRPHRDLRPLTLLLVAAVTGAGSCGGSDSPTDPEPTPDPVASIIVAPVGVELEVGASRPVSATVRTQSGADVTSSTALNWSSEASTVASVTGSGSGATVTGVGGGSTRIRASAGGVTGTADVVVLPPLPVITTSTLPGGEVGIPYAATLAATGGNGTFTWAVQSGTLPTGLTLDGASGVVSGTPVAEGNFAFTLAATSAGRTGTRALSIPVAPGQVEATTVVVNVDFMQSVLPQFGDVVYSGDNGILSSAGGTFWNGADAFTSLTDALDENGAVTPVDMIENVSGGIFIGAATNELQDNGIVSGGLPDNGFTWQGLREDEPYDLAFYVYHENRIENSTTFRLSHDGTTTTVSTTNDSSWSLPGEPNRDYILFEQVRPVELAPGVWGFRVDELSSRGAIVGAQLRGRVGG